MAAAVVLLLLVAVWSSEMEVSYLQYFEKECKCKCLLFVESPSKHFDTKAASGTHYMGI